MKLKASGYIVTIILGLLSMAGAAQGALLTCKPGPGLDIYYRATTGNLHVNFVRSPRSARAFIAPGTCAWENRGVRNNEPNTTCDPVNDIHFGFKTGSNRVYTMYSRNNQAPYLQKAFKGQIFSLWVRNYNGCLDVVPQID